MPKTIPQTDKSEQIERLIHGIDNLSFNIERLHSQNRDYSQFFIQIIMALKETGNGMTGNGCLKKIHQELRLLNKTMIMSALLLSATKDPEKTLNEYHKIIEQYIN